MNGNNVIDLNQARPHMSGVARCLSCRHEWDGIAPIGSYESLECPNCSLQKGEFVNNVVPPDGTAVFTCDCGSDLFFVRKEGVMCRLCGIITGYDQL